MGLVVRFIGPCFDKDFVQKYWEINEIPKFEHRVEDLIKLKGFSSMREGTNYIRANSIAILQCDDCAKIIGEYRVRSEVKIEKYQDKEGLFCDDCFASKTHPIQIIEKVIVVKKDTFDSIDEKINFAFKTEQWLDLNELELEVLIKIAESTSKNEMSA